MWSLGEALAYIVADFIGLVIDLIATCFSRGRPPTGPSAPQAQAPEARMREAFDARRQLRERERGAAFERYGTRIADIVFSRGELAGRRASELTTRRLRLLADSWPDRAVRFGIRRYLDLHRPGWRIARER